MMAPETSSLNIFQHGRRSGFCELATSVGQEMAQLDDNRLPPEGLLNHTAFQIHLNGNASLGDFTNRIKFDGHVQFDVNREWRSLDLKIFAHGLALNLDSTATNQTLNFSLESDGVSIRRTLTFAELSNPNQLVRALAGDMPGGGLLAGLELPVLAGGGSKAGAMLHWHAWRTRILVHGEQVPVYRLETSVLDRPITILVSTLGEILRVELPGDVVATLDEWGES
jgi:hypothetical protein